MERSDYYRICPVSKAACRAILCEHQCYMDEKECREERSHKECPVTSATCHNPECHGDKCAFDKYPFEKQNFSVKIYRCYEQQSLMVEHFLKIIDRLTQQNETLLSINQKLNKMSEVNDQINATVDALSTSLDKIKADIATLASEINPGGLTAAEATALQAKLNALAGKAADIDALTPDAPTV